MRLCIHIFQSKQIICRSSPHLLLVLIYVWLALHFRTISSNILVKTINSSMSWTKLCSILGKSLSRYWSFNLQIYRPCHLIRRFSHQSPKSVHEMHLWIGSWVSTVSNSVSASIGTSHRSMLGGNIAERMFRNISSYRRQYSHQEVRRLIVLIVLILGEQWCSSINTTRTTVVRKCFLQSVYCLETILTSWFPRVLRRAARS